jgi:hypothetical protein
VKFTGSTLTSGSFPYVCFVGDTSAYSGSGLYLAGDENPEYPLHVSLWTLDYPIQCHLVNDTWYHVTFTYPGGGWSSSTIKVYVNGVEHTLGSNRSTGTNGTAASFTTTNINVKLATTGTSSVFDGSIANFRLFNRALTGDEVWQLYSYQREYFGHGNLDMTLKSGVLGVQGGIKVNNYPFSSAACLQVSTSQNQSLNQSNYQTVTFNNIDVDTINGWDTTFNRYQPQVPGFYIVNAQRFNVGATNSYVVCLIRKNEVDVCSATIVGGGSNYPMDGVTALVYLNGTTDYVYVLGLAHTTINLTAQRSLHIIHVSF